MVGNIDKQQNLQQGFLTPEALLSEEV